MGIRELRRTLEQKPDHRGAQAALGHALVRSGHRREGMALLESAVARGAHDSDVDGHGATECFAVEQALDLGIGGT